MSQPGRTVRLRIIVTGRVQGVSFRAGARDQARGLGISGFARNRADGSVLIETEGDPSAVERFRAWCETGPPSARVSGVDVAPVAVTGERGFTAR